MLKRLGILVLSLIVLFISGCSIQYPNPFNKEEEIIISDLPAEAVYIDGPAIYNETVKLINTAEKSIYVEQSEFNDPELIKLLIAKAESGVEVKILLDQWQKINRSTVTEFKNHNISVQYYPARKGQYNHAKILVVDNEQAMIYGPGWTQEEMNKHNVAVRLSGRSAWRTATVFDRDWEFTTTLSLDVPSTSDLPDDHITLATNTNVKNQVLTQIEASTESIWLELNALSEPDTVQALIDAANRGVDVRIILDAENAQDTPVTLENLTTAGITPRYYHDNTGRALGMNIGIFDQGTFVMSSSGWTYYSFVINHEFSATVPSPQASTRLVEMFTQDWQASDTVLPPPR